MTHSWGLCLPLSVSFPPHGFLVSCSLPRKPVRPRRSRLPAFPLLPMAFPITCFSFRALCCIRHLASLKFAVPMYDHANLGQLDISWGFHRPSFAALCRRLSCCRAPCGQLQVRSWKRWLASSRVLVRNRIFAPDVISIKLLATGQVHLSTHSLQEVSSLPGGLSVVARSTSLTIASVLPITGLITIRCPASDSI